MSIAKRIAGPVIVPLVVLMCVLGTKAAVRWWTICRATRSAAGGGRVLTLTELPRLPEVSWKYAFRNPDDRERVGLLRRILAVKLQTYPRQPCRHDRAGKHRTMGFANFEPNEAQLETLATHYDAFYLSASASHRIATIKRCNPRAKVLMYFASSLTEAAKLHDAGSVDEEDTAWILKNHSDWLLRDSRGRVITGQSWSPKYWADPGNVEWQEFFAAKLNLALDEGEGPWDGVILDEFLTGHSSTAASWAGGSRPQAMYTTDRAWQEAQLAFLRRVVPLVKAPLVVNVEPEVLNPTSGGFDPEFFTEVQRIAAGAEAEIFLYHRPHRDGFLGKEMAQVYLDRARQTPQGKMMFLNSATAATFAGNPDLTLFSYFTYLLVASPEREIYWTCKEGDSEIPHFWYKEFDLDLGTPQEEMQTAGRIWKRDYANATIIVNPGEEPVSYSFDGEFVDVRGRSLRSPVLLAAQTGMLLIRNGAILPPAERALP